MVSEQLNAHRIGKKLSAVRLIQNLFLETDTLWSLPEVFQMILRSLDDVLEFKRSKIYLMNENGETLSFQSSWGYPENHEKAEIRIGQGFIGMAARTGKVIRIGDLRKNFRYLNTIRARNAASSIHRNQEQPEQLLGLFNLESLMSVPLITKIGVIGVIAVESQNPCAFDEIDQELLLLIAGQTARLIEESRRTEINRRRQEGLIHAKIHLNRLNVFLDAVTSAVSLDEPPTYATAMAKQMKGFSYAQNDSELARTYFEQAADIFQEIGMVLEMVRSKLGAAMLTLPGRPNDAAQILEECLIGFNACGASSYAELTRTLIARLQTEDGGLQQLTKRERAVAVLIAQNLSNAEIAECLHVSVRTVTTHLERIYAKLELRSRAALARYIGKYT